MKNIPSIFLPIGHHEHRIWYSYTNEIITAHDDVLVNSSFLPLSVQSPLSIWTLYNKMPCSGGSYSGHIHTWSASPNCGEQSAGAF